MNKENQMIAKLKDKADETIQQMDEINTKLVQELREKSRTLRNNSAIFFSFFFENNEKY